MLRSSYRINLVGGARIDGDEFFEVEADRVVTKLKDLKQGDLLTIDHSSGLQLHIPCWQILSIETTPVSSLFSGFAPGTNPGAISLRKIF